MGSTSTKLLAISTYMYTENEDYFCYCGIHNNTTKRQQLADGPYRLFFLTRRMQGSFVLLAPATRRMSFCIFS